jgi:nifR3 family TIM-barrel protein
MNYWQESFSIGSLSVPRFISGPLDGITDSPFRCLVREFSSQELLYGEMRHVANIANAPKIPKALEFQQLERPFTFQIAANGIEFIDRACERILQTQIDVLDLNVGCPANNVIGSGSGSALMAQPEKLKEIVTYLRRRLTIPFTVKIRAGFREKNAVYIAQMLQDCGIDALAIHPRLQTQKFEGQPDYALAAQVKKVLTIPMIISGNVVNFATARSVYEQTGADAFLIGRAMWGRPWKLAELKAQAAGEPFEISRATITRYGLKHFQAMLSYYGVAGLHAYRKHLPFYLRGLPDASQLRQKLITSNSVEEVTNTFQELSCRYGS